MFKIFQAANSAKPYIIELSSSLKNSEKSKFDVDYSIITNLLRPLNIFQNWLEVFEGDELGN